MHPAERQLTHGPGNKNLDNNINFSPDGKWLVFDCRGEGGIGGNGRLGKVNVETGEVVNFYEQKPPIQGVGAASFLNNREVIAIHGVTGLLYDLTLLTEVRKPDGWTAETLRRPLLPAHCAAARTNMSRTRRGSGSASRITTTL